MHFFGHDPRWSNLVAMEHHWDSIEHNLQLLLSQCLRHLSGSWSHLLRHLECNWETQPQGTAKTKPKAFQTQNCVGWGVMTISLHHLTISGESVRNYDLYNKCLAVITWSQCHWPANQDNATASQTAEIDKHQKIPTHPHIWTSVSLHRSKSCRFTPNDWFPNTLQYIWLYMACVLSSLALFGQLQFSVVNSKPEITAHDLQIWSPMEPLNFEWCKVVPPYLCLLVCKPCCYCLCYFMFSHHPNE